MRPEVIASTLLALAGCADAAPPPPREPLPPLPPLSQLPPLVIPAAATPPDLSVLPSTRSCRACEAYVKQVSLFLRRSAPIPKTFSVEPDLCVVFEVEIDRGMVVERLRRVPIRSSGNESFDDVVRARLVQLEERKAQLPPPPPEIEDFVRGRFIHVAVLSDPDGDAKICAR